MRSTLLGIATVHIQSLSLALVLLVGVGGGGVLAQPSSGAIYKTCLKSIAFKKGTPGFHEMHKDESVAYYTSPTSITEENLHQFRQTHLDCASGSTGTVEIPSPTGNRAPGVVYESNSKPHLGAVLLTHCSTPIYVRATWNLGNGTTISFAPKLITPVGTQVPNHINDPQYQLNYGFVEGDKAFDAGVIRAFESAQITVQVANGSSSPPGSDGWITIGTGGPDVYVLAAKPKNQISNAGVNSQGVAYGIPLKVRYTSVRNSCFHGNNRRTLTELLQGIFTGYLGSRAATQGKDGDKLSYWNTPGTAASGSLEEFFIENDSKCGFWTAYLSEMINVHGFNISEQPVYSKDNYTVSELRIIDYQIRRLSSDYIRILNPYYEEGSEREQKPLFAVTVEDLNLYQPIGLTPNPWDGRRIPADPQRWFVPNSLPAQNTNTPTALFGDHIMHEYNGNIYDPSYGVIVQGPSQESSYENGGIKITRCAILLGLKSDLTADVYLIPLESATPSQVKLLWP